MASRKDGFTLMELLVVVGVIGILVSIAIPSFAAARMLAQRAGCKGTLKSIGSGLAIYLEANGNKYPHVTNYPSLELNDLPNLSRALKRYVASEVLRCPADSIGLYETEGSSYEYNTILSGKHLKDAMFGNYLGSLYMPVVWDYEWFHGKPGEDLAMNYLYADGTVRGLGQNE